MKIDRRCVDCGIDPPTKPGQVTLTSVQHGWRLVKAVDAYGQAVMQWRCRECWMVYRQRLSRSGPG